MSCFVVIGTHERETGAGREIKSVSASDSGWSGGPWAAERERAVSQTKQYAWVKAMVSSPPIHACPARTSIEEANGPLACGLGCLVRQRLKATGQAVPMLFAAHRAVDAEKASGVDITKLDPAKKAAKKAARKPVK